MPTLMVPAPAGREVPVSNWVTFGAAPSASNVMRIAPFGVGADPQIAQRVLSERGCSFGQVDLLRMRLPLVSGLGEPADAL